MINQHEMDNVSINIIEVHNCHDCPFCNNDNEFGRDLCNLNHDLYAKNFEEMPANDVHLYCPLKNNYFLVKQA
jgi:predicted ArsR family transcriptional regulator